MNCGMSRSGVSVRVPVRITSVRNPGSSGAALTLTSGKLGSFTWCAVASDTNCAATGEMLEKSKAIAAASGWRSKGGISSPDQKQLHRTASWHRRLADKLDGLHHDNSNSVGTSAHTGMTTPFSLYGRYSASRAALMAASSSRLEPELVCTSMRRALRDRSAHAAIRGLVRRCAAIALGTPAGARGCIPTFEITFATGAGATGGVTDSGALSATGATTVGSTTG